MRRSKVAPLFFALLIIPGLSACSVDEPGGAPKVGSSFEFQSRLDAERRAIDACPNGYTLQGANYRCNE